MSKIQIAKSLETIEQCFPVMKELRPHICREDFVSQVIRQQESGYELAFIEETTKIKSLAGFREAEYLAWGKVLYIDDLITAPEACGNGYGSTLLKYLIEEAKKRKCAQIHLDTGHHRHDAHRVYLKHGFQIKSHHMAMVL